MLTKPIAVEAREGFKIWIKYESGEAGELDLSHIAGIGVFSAWNERAMFEDVWITEYDSIRWGGMESDEIELCADALYLQLTGKSIEEIHNRGRVTLTNA